MNTEEEPEFYDYICRPQMAVKVLEDEYVVSKLFDKTLEPIIIVLRGGPLTIKELVKEYNRIAEDKKSEMTIYRYVKDLDKLDIVKEVGKRTKTGQSASETLYGRTAKIFWNLTPKDDYWKSDKSKKMLETLRGLLALYMKDTTINSKDLGDLLDKTSKKYVEELAAFFEENDNQVNKLISGLSFREVDKITETLGNLILLMKCDDFSKELEKCGC